MKNPCFHCHEVIKESELIAFDYQQQPLYFCCFGCACVCQTVIELGNFDYYKRRTEIAKRPDENLFANPSTDNLINNKNDEKPAGQEINWHNTEALSNRKSRIDFASAFNTDYLEQIKIYDDEALINKYITIIEAPVLENQGTEKTTHTSTDKSIDSSPLYQCTFDVYDMTCSACAWLIEKSLSKKKAITDIKLNYSSETLQLTWKSGDYTVSDIISIIQKIGYKVVPHKGDAMDAFDKKQKELLKRLGITALFAMQIMMLSVALYAGHFQGMDDNYKLLMQKASMILALPVILYSAQPFYLSAWRSLKNWHLNMDVPICIAVILAFTSSVYHTIGNSALLKATPSQGVSSSLPFAEVYFDSVSMLICFLLLSRFFEAKAKRKSNQQIRKLAEVIPLYANRYDYDKSTFKNLTSVESITDFFNKMDYKKVAAERLIIDDIILLKRGETLAADGVILSGTSQFNQSVITGESKLIDKSINDNVIAGGINSQNDVIIQCHQVGQETTLHKINALAKSSQQQKPIISQHVDKLARYFTTVLLLIATVAAFYWYQHAPDRWIQITLAILVVTCPCALSLATPVSIAAAISRLLEKGVLLKDVTALTALAKIKHIIFDKTGTLTKGNLQLSSLINLTSQSNHKAISDNQIWHILTTMEKDASHNVAQAIISANAAREKSYHGHKDYSELALTVTQFDNGVMAKSKTDAEHQTYFFGNIEFIINHTNIDQSVINNEVLANSVLAKATLDPNDPMQENALFNSNLSILATQNSLVAISVFSDELKEDSRSLLQALQQKNYQTTLLSGDSENIVAALANTLQFSQHRAEQSPEQKLAYVKALQLQNQNTLMIGDGINDAPVLAASNVSMAVKNASNYAIAESDLVLINSDMMTVEKALTVAKKTNRIIKQNLCWSLLYNISVVPAAVMGLVHPLFAAIGMSLSSLIVVLNALRILKS